MAFLRGGSYVDGDLLVEGSLKVKSIADIEGRQSVKYDTETVLDIDSLGRALIIVEDEEGCVKPSNFQFTIDNSEITKLKFDDSLEILTLVSKLKVTDTPLVLNTATNKWEYQT